MRLPQITALLLLCLAAPGFADTFLLKDRSRVIGTEESVVKDDDGISWTTVRALYGTVRFPTKQLKKRLKTKGNSRMLYVEEMRVIFVSGDVRKSSDGKVWEAVNMPSASATNENVTPPWPTVRPGDFVRSGKDGSLELDLGFGVLHLDHSSEMRLHAAQGSTLSLLRGRVGADVSPPEGERSFTVETPVAAMGVRGTRFFVTVGQDGKSARVGVDEGEVAADDASVDAGLALDLPSGEFGELTGEDRAYVRRLLEIEGFPEIEWAALPGGSFKYGQYVNTTPLDTTPRPFLMSRTEVTQAHHDAFVRWYKKYGIDPFLIPGRPAMWEKDTFEVEERTEDGPSFPAMLSWHRAYALAYWLGADLPSEVQWEYAASGGATTRYWWGDEERDVVDHEWVYLNSGDEPLQWVFDMGLEYDPMMAEAKRLAVENNCRVHEVGRLPANGFGLHDMIGNLQEWCRDAWDPDFATSPTDGSPRTNWNATARAGRGHSYLTTHAVHPRVRSPMETPTAQDDDKIERGRDLTGAPVRRAFVSTMLGVRLVINPKSD